MPQPESYPEPVSNPSEARPRRRWRRRLGVLAATILGLLALVLGGGLWMVRASLPQLEGSRSLAGLAGEVVVDRDALGVPTVRAANRVDAARALGFLHA